MYRIIGVDGREYGPISADQLRQWIAQNRANATTPTLAEGAPDWKPLGSLPEFSMLFTSAPASYPTSPVPLQKSSAFATTSLILGVVSLTAGLCCCYGLPFNVTGLVFSIIALGQIKSNPDRYTGTGMAITGLILCSLSLVLMTILMIIALLTSGLGHTTHHGYRL